MLLSFVRKVPVARFLLPYLAGVLLLSSQGRLMLCFVTLGGWSLLLHRYLSTRLPSAWPVRWMPGVGICFLWMVLGGLNVSRLDNRSAFPKQTGIFCARVRLLSSPEEKTRSLSCRALVELPETNFGAWKGKRLQLYLSKDWQAQGLNIGDRLLIRLNPNVPAPPEYPGAFNYADWLRHQGVCGTAYVSGTSGRLVSKASVFAPKVLAERLRQLLLERFSRAGIDGQEYALVSALVLGTREDLLQETKDAFSVTGISHILSVSGLHVGVIYGVLAFLLSLLDPYDRFRVPKQLFLVAFLFGYAFVTGLSPSVLRSAFMFSLLAFGKCFHRKSQTLNTVLFSAFVLLLVDPGFLYDLGFQLSYLAVFSIVVVHPKLTALWTPSSAPVKYVWEMLCLSLTAQLGTAPLTLHAFHVFPNYFLLNNLLAVPFSALIIYLSAGFLVFSGLPLLGFWSGRALDACLHVFLTLTEAAAGLPHALTENLHPDSFQVVGMYGLMIAFFVWFLEKKRRWIFPFLTSVLIYQILYAGRYFWW
jgi:competence protein ComEC